MNYHLVFLIIFMFLFTAPASGGERLDGRYQTTVKDVIDGDTFSARIKVWLGQEIETLVRINGIDTAELRSTCPHEKALAQDAKARVTQIIAGKTVTLSNITYGKYAGRIVADVDTDEAGSVANILINAKLARLYHGKQRTAWC